MNITFEQLSKEHQTPAMKIYNYYVETTTSAFPSEPMPEEYFHKFLELAGDKYPAYAIMERQRVIGFCMLSAYHPAETFYRTACITIFIDKEYTGKGIGKICMDKLIRDGRKMGISHYISDISSENEASMKFHEKYGFTKVGDLPGIGEKLGREFGIVLMEYITE